MATLHAHEADHSRPTYFPPLTWLMIGTLVVILGALAAM